MDREQLRNELLSLLPGKVDIIDEFLNRVDETNEIAMTRIARATTTVNTQVVEEEVAEVTEEVVEVEAEVVETETETEVVEETVETEEETEEITFELDENFIPDLVGSEEFRTALNGALESALNGVRNEFEERFRSLQTRVEEQEEVIQDVPARQKRAVVGYRPTAVASEDVPVEQRQRTYQEIADDSISAIFD